MARVLHQPITPTATLTITITTPTLAQLTLAATADLDAACGITVAGGTAPYAYAWSSATGGTFTDATALDSGWTPAGGGVHTLVLVVTDADGATATAAVKVTVGDADGRVQRHHADWTAAGSAVDFGGGATSKTIDGLQYDRYMPGSVNTFAATDGVGLSIDPNSDDAGVRIAGNALSVGMETDVIYYAALAADSLNSDGDQLSMVVACAAGPWATIYARRNAGVQQIGTYTAGGQAQETTAGGTQIRQLALRIRGYQVEVYYSETALSGDFLPLSSMTKASTAPSGFFVLDNQHGGDTSDSRVPASDLFYWVVPTASTGAVVITHTEIRY